MAQYCITMERTLRISKWFEAASDEAAEEVAQSVLLETDASEFEDGDIEFDYAVCSEDGLTIVDWY